MFDVLVDGSMAVWPPPKRARMNSSPFSVGAHHAGRDFGDADGLAVQFQAPCQSKGGEGVFAGGMGCASYVGDAPNSPDTELIWHPPTWSWPARCQHHGDNTEILPRLRDIRPPTRPTLDTTTTMGGKRP
ncbi:hypothetical protein ACIBJI_23910 [Nocardia sp. NPDC050408]|uniref:hypothetical protein n=1 Tax=Nocardia sp. NPDC050408 TaxID=3364319 RepID=UPI0037975FB4